jgi:CRP-like cAMP-binding protein
MFQPRRLVADETPTDPVTTSSTCRQPPTIRALSRGDHLFVAGAPAGPISMIVTGAVALARNLPDGRRQIVDILGPGRLVGLCLDDIQPSTATALVRTHVRLLAAPPSAEAIACELGLGIRRVHAHTVLLGRKTALEKVASGLLELAHLFADRRDGERGVSFVLPMTRTDLGDWLGLVMETVSRALGDLQRQRLIALERGDIVHLLDPVSLGLRSGDRPMRPVPA